MTSGTPKQYSTRIIRSHSEWVPHGYQERAVDHLLARGAAALFLDPGLGKTAIVLEAFRQLKAAGVADKMLVVAPLRVCQLVWAAEGAKWTQFRDLTFSLLHGPKKEQRLRDDVDIHLINPEGIAWLAAQFFGRTDLPWDTVVIDELTKFKNARAARSKKLRTKITGVARRWGLTGTPAPNGYMDLFGQMLILDDGAALGRFITYYRDQYFKQGYTGFDYELKPGAAERIEARIAPYVLRMSAEEYGSLPPLIDNVIHIELPAKARKQYEEMKQEMLLALPEGTVTAANSGAVYSKLSQMANGAVYVQDHDYIEIHDAKLDAVEELIEELAGQPLLIAYEFQHDLHRLRERLGKDTPTLAGLSHKRIMEVEAAWNRGEIPVLLAHPASAGHGLNLQGAGASHICWFSRPWDLELYDQFIRRLLRQGTTAAHIINHVLCVRDSMDEIKAEALDGKNTTQQKLLNALNTTLRGGPAPINGEDTDMAVKKLSFLGASGAAPAAAEQDEEKPTTARVPKGWGAAPAMAEEPEPTPQKTPPQRPQRPDAPKRPVGWGPPAAPDEQTEAITQKIAAPAPQDADEEDGEEPPASVRALAAFPKGIQQALTGNGEADENEAAVAKEFKGNEINDPAEPFTEPGDESRGWGDLGGRAANPLREHGFDSPEEAYAKGKDWLISNVARFGEKSWEMLEEHVAVPETDDDGEPQRATAQSLPAGWGAQVSEKRAEQESPVAEKAAEKAAEHAAEAEQRRFYGESVAGQLFTTSPGVEGVNPDTLATLFETIASLLRGR